MPTGRTVTGLAPGSFGEAEAAAERQLAWPCSIRKQNSGVQACEKGAVGRCLNGDHCLQWRAEVICILLMGPQRGGEGHLLAEARAYGGGTTVAATRRSRREPLHPGPSSSSGFRPSISLDQSRPRPQLCPSPCPVSVGRSCLLRPLSVSTAPRSQPDHRLQPGFTQTSQAVSSPRRDFKLCSPSALRLLPPRVAPGPLPCCPIGCCSLPPHLQRAERHHLS